MQVNKQVQEFIEGKIKSSDVFKPFFEAGLQLYYLSAPENPQTPYVRFAVESVAVQGRSLSAMQPFAAQCIITMNVIGNSSEQVRLLSQELFDLFNATQSAETNDHIQDITSTNPEEIAFYDNDTKQLKFETAQTLTFNYVF